MSGPSVTILNPIFYDLGGVFTPSVEALNRVDSLLVKHYSWERCKHEYEYMAYNFSYLALHIPKLCYVIDTQRLTILNTDVEVSLQLSIRVCGNICFEYEYHIPGLATDSITAITEALQCYINLSYSRYLKRNNAYKNAMTRIAKPAVDDTIPPILNHCKLLEEIKGFVRQSDAFKPDSYCYPYQHGRLLYACDSDSDYVCKELLDEGFESTVKRLDDGRILLGTWKTILMVSQEKRATFMDLYIESLSRFFQCQTWIFQCEHRLDQINRNIDSETQSYTLLNQEAKDIETFYFTCNREMINFDNLSIPFKNDDYTFLSASINDALKLDGHIAQTYKHLDAVKEHINLAKLHIDSRTEKHAKLLKLLMGLNLSAGIASLIPASLDGDIAKISSSMLPPIVWVTFALIAFTVLIVEFRKRS